MTLNFDGAASRNFHLNEGRKTLSSCTHLHGRADGGCSHTEVSPDTKLGPVFPKLDGVAPLDILPRHLTECHINPSAVTASHSWTILEQAAEPPATTYHQSLKLKVASTCLSPKSLSHWTPWCVTAPGNQRLRVSRCQVDANNCAHICAQEKAWKGNFEMPSGWPLTILFQEGKDLLPGALFVWECWTHPSPPPRSLSLSQQASHAGLPPLGHANSEPAAAEHLHHARADWSPESAGPAQLFPPATSESTDACRASAASGLGHLRRGPGRSRLLLPRTPWGPQVFFFEMLALAPPGTRKGLSAVASGKPLLKQL